MARRAYGYYWVVAAGEEHVALWDRERWWIGGMGSISWREDEVEVLSPRLKSPSELEKEARKAKKSK